jgi:hypothetical protein
MMELKKNTLIMGLGNCGCKIAKLFAGMEYTTMFANGSEQDLRILGDVNGVYKLSGYDGFGGHRERAYECLLKNEHFIEALENIKQKIIVLIYATGGSTGSGLSTNVAQYILDTASDTKIIVTVPVIPAEQDINKRINSYQANQELMTIEGIGATIFLDNRSCPNGNDLRYINKTFATTFDAFLTDDSYGEPNNFDESERLEMLSERGAMILSFAKEGKINPFNENIFAPLQGDKVVGNFGIIHSGQKHTDVSVDNLITEIGRPLNTYEGWGGKNTLIAISGLSYPIDYITQIGKLAMDGQTERNRNIEQAKAQNLPTLDFGLTKRQETMTFKDNKPKLSGREALIAMAHKMSKQ